MTTLYLNGSLLPLEEGRVSVEDRGFQFGDGVYEVIRVYNGRPFRLDAHLARLERSLEGVRIPPPEPLPRLAEICRQVLGSLKEATIYLQITRGAAPRAHAFPSGIRPTVLAYARPLQPAPESKTYTLRSVPDDRWGRCHLKTICLLPNILARQKAVESGCDEGLFVRDDGSVTEGTASNAFFVFKNVLRTHPADSRILNGITREIALFLARRLDISVEERPVKLPEARQADEIFMTGTTAEIMPVTALDGKPLAPGPVTARLRAAFRELVGSECG
ncbi:MAG TPA: D-amino acid aminotransferase [Planctomycetota bacterium]|jgi:D-alanine transaminase|nr:D-amino acid aminotransferase [Planctomycetota bacterium]